MNQSTGFLLREVDGQVFTDPRAVFTVYRIAQVKKGRFPNTSVSDLARIVKSLTQTAYDPGALLTPGLYNLTRIQVKNRLEIQLKAVQTAEETVNAALGDPDVDPETFREALDLARVLSYYNEVSSRLNFHKWLKENQMISPSGVIAIAPRPLTASQVNPRVTQEQIQKWMSSGRSWPLSGPKK